MSMTLPVLSSVQALNPEGHSGICRTRFSLKRHRAMILTNFQFSLTPSEGCGQQASLQFMYSRLSAGERSRRGWHHSAASPESLHRLLTNNLQQVLPRRKKDSSMIYRVNGLGSCLRCGMKGLLVVMKYFLVFF